MWRQLAIGFAVGLALAAPPANRSVSAQGAPDPAKLVEQADRLAWLKAWTRAEPLYEQAARLFNERGDRRNALYAEINHLRGELPRLPIAEVSQRLAEYLEDPIVQSDDRVRLRCLVIKGETDEDLDPSLSQRSWEEALAIAQKIGENAWANRAQGEIGLSAFLQGDINTSIVKLGQALKVAESNGDVASVVRWLTLFGHGYSELGRPEQALDFYDRALKVASAIPELQFPVMTYLGKGDVLVKLGQLKEADQLLSDGLAFATREGALGYEAELTYKQGLIAFGRKQPTQAIELLKHAIDLGHQAGGNRIVAEVSVDLARIQLSSGLAVDAERTLRDGVQLAREMAEHLLLPRLLAQLADLKASQHQYTEAGNLLDEANDMLEGLLTNASSPWVRSRVIGGMSDVYLERIRVEALRGQGPSGVFSVVEQAHGRSLLELLLASSVADARKSSKLQAGERRISSLQLKLLRTTDRAERRRLLDQIFIAEEQLAPAETELFSGARGVQRKPLTLQQVQRTLRSDEVLLEFALAEPDSYSIVVTHGNARIRQLPSQSIIEKSAESLIKAVRGGNSIDTEARNLGRILLDRVSELSTHNRVIVSADGALHQLPFDVLVDTTGKPLLASHVVSYVQSGSVLATLRGRPANRPAERYVLAIAASAPAERESVNGTGATSGVERGVYDIDASKLPPLPAAADEARAVAAALGESRSTILVGDSANEFDFKKIRLADYRVLHFAVHGITSTKFPARSALLLRPAGQEDGLLQAREILTMRMPVELVTLSACETGTGTLHGEEGVSSLVRPFIAAGARTVIANLWSADDQFSLGLMREFYRQLAAGADIAAALRHAKLKLIEQFGHDATPKLWSGVLVYGDGSNVVMRTKNPSN
jgi:CHAT domain-containing protein/Tfp pilus assembly protein PilF